MQIPSKNSRKAIQKLPFPIRAASRRSSFFSSLRAMLFLILGSSLILCPLAARSQVMAPPPLTPPGFPSAEPPNSHNTDPELRRMTEHMAMERNTQRQQKIVADTARLLDLAKELNNAVSRSTKDTLSIAVVKKAEEIEKLAKTIKNKMRDGD